MVVMNEWLSDLTTYLEGYETSTDPMPYVRSLMKRDDGFGHLCRFLGYGHGYSQF